MITTRIPSARIEWLEKIINKLNKRARKFGFSEFTLSLGTHSFIPGKRSGEKIEVVEVSIDGEQPEVNGWKFAASLEHEVTGNIVRAIPGIDVPELYRTVAANCDHCGYNRRRNETYVILKDEEYKQVGSTCLQDFTGGLNAAEAAKAAESWFDLGSALKVAESDEETDGDGWLNKVEFFDLVYFLTVAAAMVRQFGYVSRSAARSDPAHLTATADRALDVIDANKGADFIVDADKALAEAALSWARDVWLVTSDSVDDYRWNMGVVLFKDEITRRQIGYASSLLRVYERRNETGKSEWVGKVGEKISVEVTVVSKNPVSTQWGVKIVHIFADANGNQFSYFGDEQAVELNETLTLSGTIKAHEQYGIKRTAISRPKFLKGG